MKKIFIAMFIAMFMIGCGSSGSTSSSTTSPTEVRTGKHIIYDNDHFDPDWVIGLDTVLELHKLGTITVDAIVLTGIDAYQKAGLKYKTIVDYHGIDIPIGINHRTHMRITPDDASVSYPTLDPRYKGGYKDITEFPSDNLMDNERIESVTLLCKVLEKAEYASVTYIVGGHLQNFSDLLKEKVICNGYELIHSKVKELVINTGGVNGKPEMNLSEGRYNPTSASEATINVFSNTYIPILVASEFSSGSARPGDVYLNYKIGSPQEFIIAVPRYGTYGDHGISDNPAVMVGVYGTNIHGNEYVTKTRTCFIPNPVHGALTLGSGCDKEHYILNNMNLNLVGNYTIELLRLP